ncbi:MAG: hypothetical protein OTJ97_05650 [SAR202 cluster bacterium]|nr:hypothetical protein [SAR202 cluster bacterium]
MPGFVLAFGLIAIILIVTSLASGLVERSPLSFPLIFLGFGFDAWRELFQVEPISAAA